MIAGLVRGLLDSPNMAGRRPVVDAKLESNIPGLFVIGDLSGAPVVKFAMEHGYDTAAHIASLADARATAPGAYDVIVVGAGAAGLNAALAAQEKGLRVIVLEKAKIANTIEDFPEGKWVYAEPDARPAKGKLWLDGAAKEDLLARWRAIIDENRLDVRTEEGVTAIRRRADKHFDVTTPKGAYSARRVILATGQRGNPRKLGVRGEERERVYHRLYSPGHYQGEDIVVVGGGNSAVEAALTLAERNRVTLSYRGSELARVFADNERKLNEAVKAGRIRVVFQSNVKEFGERTLRLEINESGGKRVDELPYDHAFVLVGAEVPAEFLKSLGLKLENEWEGNPWFAALALLATMFGLWLFGGQTGHAALAGLDGPGAALALAGLGGLVALGWKGNRWAWLAVSFLICYTVYGAKYGKGVEFWPYRGWGFEFFSFFGRPMYYWYTVIYTVLMTVFGMRAMKRWGLDRNDRFQIWRYACLLAFQWIFFFLLPEFLFQYAVKYQWVGELAKDPNFANQAWRSYGLVYAWPLFFYTFFWNPHQIWVVWGVLLTFVVLPLFVLFHGKRYCSWICGCGGLAETLGDRWRHLAPKGRAAVRWEWMGTVILGVAAAVTVLVLASDAWNIWRAPAAAAIDWYKLIVDVWLVGILPVTLYPFFGGKVWCRYWCPLAKMMQFTSAFWAKLRVGRFAIHSNDKCIGCGECSRNCQVGIDVMNFALKQRVLDNTNTSCIGCGVCVSVCPMDVLSFEQKAPAKLVQIQPAR